MANNLALVIDRPGVAGRARDVDHAPVGVQKGAQLPAAGLRPAHHLAEVVDTVGITGRTTQRAQVMGGATAEGHRTAGRPVEGKRVGTPIGRSDHQTGVVDGSREAIRAKDETVAERQIRVEGRQGTEQGNAAVAKHRSLAVGPGLETRGRGINAADRGARVIDGHRIAANVAGHQAEASHAVLEDEAARASA